MKIEDFAESIKKRVTEQLGTNFMFQFIKWIKIMG